MHIGMLVYLKRLHSYNFSLADQRITMAARLKNRCHSHIWEHQAGNLKLTVQKAIMSYE